MKYYWKVCESLDVALKKFCAVLQTCFAEWLGHTWVFVAKGRLIATHFKVVWALRYIKASGVEFFGKYRFSCPSGLSSLTLSELALLRIESGAVAGLSAQLAVLQIRPWIYPQLWLENSVRLDILRAYALSISRQKSRWDVGLGWFRISHHDRNASGAVWWYTFYIASNSTSLPRQELIL